MAHSQSLLVYYGKEKGVEVVTITKQDVEGVDDHDKPTNGD